MPKVLFLSIFRTERPNTWVILSGTERPYTTEHNGPILLDVRGLISLRFQNRTSQYFGHSEWNTMSQYFFLSWVLFLSLTFGHITLKSVWSSLNLVWHMSCRTSIVPVNIHQFEPCCGTHSYISDRYMFSIWTYSISWLEILYILHVPLSFEWLAFKWNLIVLLADALAQQTSLTSIALLVHSILQIMFSHFIQIILKKRTLNFNISA